MGEWAWLNNFVYPVLGLALGGGGIVAWYKARQDAKKGIREVDIAENTAHSDYWKNIIETQTRSLLDPLVSRVASLEAEVTVLRAEAIQHEKERRLLWRWIEDLLDYVDDLVEHINDRKEPPAPVGPVRPEGL